MSTVEIPSTTMDVPTGPSNNENDNESDSQAEPDLELEAVQTIEKENHTNDESSSQEGRNAKSNTISRTTAELWFEEISGYLSDLESAQLEARRVREAQEFDWKDALREMSKSIAIQESSMRGMMSSLARLLGHEDPDDEDEEKRKLSVFSVPEIHYLPWLEVAKILPPSDKRVAIEIPSNEPSALDIQFMAQNDWRNHSRSLETTDGLPKTTIPERIRINPVRLKNFLDYDFAGGSLNWNNNTSLCILRPFKFLIYFETAIRKRLVDYENTRKGLEDSSEEDYIQALNENPVNDIWTYTNAKIQYESMSVPELTALIMDCRCLIRFMDETLRPAQRMSEDVPDVIRFVDLWFLFPPGSLVYIKGSSLPQKTWKVVQRTGGRRTLEKAEDDDKKTIGSWINLKLDCYYLDFNGIRFVPIYRQFEIAGFDGTQTVKGLPILPLSIAEKEELTDRAYLKARGEQFVECTQKVAHLEYSGRSHYLTPTGQKLTDLMDEIPKSVSCYSEQIDSDVMIDFSRALDEIPWWRPPTGDHEFGKTEFAETGITTGIEQDGVWDKRFTDDYLELQRAKWNSWAKNGKGPTDDDLLILPDRVFAFVLSNRRWACLQIGRGANGVEQLRKREPQDNPWLKLRLPDGHKELVQSLINSHFAKQKSGGIHFDLLRNKGNGVTILLHGVPGVGKTSTAECAAISNGRPLLPVTCGDLGLTAGEVEDKLKETFRLAQDWGCIMLLDEADVFLAQRRAYDVERNALVSVFLRTLEYYEGILFLTTNRVGVFDEAFKSRIHMSLYYPPLDWPQTYEIWAGHIDEATNSGIHAHKGELTNFANQIYNAQLNPGSGPVWNGRQIRNAFQSALALAAFYSKDGDVIQLNTTYFFQVFKVSDKFSKYIWATQNQQDDAARNRQAMVRRDDYPVNPPEMMGLNPLSSQQAPGLQQPTHAHGFQPTASNLGHQTSQQGGGLAGGLAGGQAYMGDSLNPSSMPATSAPLGQQNPSPQMLQSQLGMTSTSVALGQQPSQFQQHQQSGPQSLQSQFNMLGINENSHQLQQLQRVPVHDQFTSQPEAMTSQIQNFVSQPLQQHLGQDVAYPSHGLPHSLLQPQQNAGQMPPQGNLPPIL